VRRARKTRRSDKQEESAMEIGLLVRIEAKPEFADQVETALRGARDLAQGEQETDPQ
jgi:hypothetical protein